ncbi:MAG: DNA repair protein RecN [Acidimicrobiales bacterium]
MLVELTVRDLGVFVDLHLDFAEGMTAVTGETGAGKTLVVEALELLMGERADPVLVRPGATEALVEGRFVTEVEEIILARSIPAAGRSRAWISGRMATAANLAETGQAMVDLHGQGASQSLRTQISQRSALDAFGRIDARPLTQARRRIAELDRLVEELGGDARSTAQRADLLGYQISEITAAAVGDPDEDDHLRREQDALTHALADREALEAARAALDGEGNGRARNDGGSGGDGSGGGGPGPGGERIGALDGLAQAHSALSRLKGRPDLDQLSTRLAAVMAEMADLSTDLRQGAESTEDDPDRLRFVMERRSVLKGLMRKYGDSVADVIRHGEEARKSLADLESLGARLDRMEGERSLLEGELATAARKVADERRAAAPGLAATVESHLANLGMDKASFQVVVRGGDPGDDVCFFLGANPGEPPLPLAKVASGGELARTMLALRLVLSSQPRTLIFDEVDAGIGGEAAGAVGRALAELARSHQVLVVTHLAQVAAFADHQIAVSKDSEGGRTVARARILTGQDRVIELSRMLSGQPSSATARDHAEELLATAAARRMQ